MPASELILYELAGADPALRFSPHCWKIRMALAHKGLDAETIAWHFTEKDAIAFSGSQHVPVLVRGAEAVSDSWRIALYLEDQFPDRPSLFNGASAIPLTEFMNAWADTALASALARIVLADIHACLHEKDRDYFRATREKAFGKRLEDVVADRPAHLAAVKQTLSPLRRVLKTRDYIAGTAPAYADYCVFGMFMWARCVSKTEVLDGDDAIAAWRQRLLDAFGGLAGKAASVQG